MKLRLIKEIPPRAAVAAAVLVLAVSVVSGRQFIDSPAPEVELAPRVARNAPLAEAGDFNLEGLRREGSGERQVIADIFAPAQDDAPTAVQPAVAAPPAKPRAPELPFRYAGKMLEGARSTVFLLKGDEPFSVSPGERVGGDYRLVAMDESELTFVYLPLGIRQRLSLAEAPPDAPARSE